MEETKTAVEQVTALFDIEPLVGFLVVAGTAIIGFGLAKKALGQARGFINRA